MYKNKKAGDKIISIYWFFILTLIAVGIVLMVNNFYKNPYDVREFESQILSRKVADCIYFGGKINPFLISEHEVFKPEFRDNFLSRCNLFFPIKGQSDDEEYYIQIKFYSDLNKTNLVFEIEEGNLNLKQDCFSDDGFKKFAKCSTNEFLAKSSGSKYFLVEIITGVRNAKENLK